MKEDFLSNKKTASIIPIVCSLLFWIFGITYLAVFQSDLMILTYYEKLNIDFLYFPWVGALAITGLLWLVQRASNLIIHFRDKLYFVSYFFSFLLLGMMTDVSPAVFEEGGKNVFSFSPWLIATGLLFYFLAVWYRRRARRLVASPFLEVLNRNLIGMVILCLYTGSIGNTNDMFQHEAAMRVALQKGDYEEILKIGEKALTSNEKINEYRIIALARLNRLGERLFEYPQEYGSKAVPKEEPEDRKTGFDYCMVSLLLDKKLETFINEAGKMKEFYSNTLPRYYKEALILYEHFHPDTLRISDRNETKNLSVQDTLLTKRFEDFLAYRSHLQEQKKIRIEKNMLRKEYGDTYWWYYLYK